MRIGIIGSGKIGSTVARLFVQAGHEVAVANSRGPESLAGLVEELGPAARGETVDGAADYGEVVLLAVPFRSYRELRAERFGGKVVIDATNYFPGRDGVIDELDADGLTSTELVGRHLAGARMAKAFNTMNFRPLASEGRPEAAHDDRLALFVAGDDDEAKRVVSGLIDEVGFAAVDTGSLAGGGRLQQPGTPLFNRPLSAAEARAALA